MLLAQRVAWHREDWRGRDAAAAGPIHHRQRQRIGTLTVGDCILRGSLQSVLAGFYFSSVFWKKSHT